MIEKYLNKITHADCLDVLRGLADNCVDLVLTDPPYGVGYQSNRRKITHKKIIGDDNLLWLSDWYVEIERVMKDGAMAVVFYGWPHSDSFLGYAKDAGLVAKSHLIWVKNNIGLGWFTRGQHEPAFLFLKGERGKPKKAISDVIYCSRTDNNMHPTQKPVALFKTLIEAFNEDGGIILDTFSGSGTTALAAHDLDRDFICIEKDKDYYEASVKRLEQHQRQGKLF